MAKYGMRFEQAYKECTKIEVAGKQALVTYSSTALAVLLLRSCNLNDIDHQIISQSLNFDEKTITEEKKTFDKTKAAVTVIAHEVRKRANHQSLPGSSAVKESKNLATYLAQVLELDPSELNDLKVWITDRRKAGKYNHRFPRNKRKV